MKKRILAIGLGTVLTLAMLTGCGKNETPTTPDTQVTETITSTSTETIVNEVVETVVEKTDDQIISEFLLTLGTTMINAENGTDVEALVSEFNNNNEKFIINSRAISVIETYINVKLPNFIAGYEVNNLTLAVDTIYNQTSDVEYYNQIDEMYIREELKSSRRTNSLKPLFEDIGWNDEDYILAEVRNPVVNINDGDTRLGHISFTIYKVEGHDEWIIVM